MKKNTLRKLTLSAVTMGVAALSLTSTTYAWFTTNGEATASGVKGTVAAADSNMLIKTATYAASKDTLNKTVATWPANFSKDLTGIESVKATQSSDEQVANNATVTPALQPVTWKDSAFVKAGSTTGNFDGVITENVDVLHYEVVFAITNLPAAQQTISVSFSEFTKNAKGSQYLLVNAGDSAVAGKTIQVNLLDVLSLRTESTVITGDYLTTYNIDKTQTDLVESITATNQNYRYKEDKQELTDVTSGSASTSSLTGDAIAYYNNVYGLTDTSVSPAKITKPTNEAQGYASSTSETYFGEENKNGITLFTVPEGNANKTVYVKTDFYFYIDGWDYQCFNCVGGLTLDAGTMNFKLN